MKEGDLMLIGIFILIALTFGIFIFTIWLEINGYPGYRP
jgi:hypothetical protein